MTKGNSSRVGASYRKLTQQEKRQVIATRKAYGDMTRIAKELGFSQSYISHVVAGRMENKVILNRVYNMVRGRKAKA